MWNSSEWRPEPPHRQHAVWRQVRDTWRELWRDAFRDFGGPETFGRGRRRDRMARGVLKYLILDALRDGPKHGYEIIKLLEERAQGFYAPSPGAIYPTLQLLEDLGLVRAESDQDRRVYDLTDAGRAELEANADLVDSIWAGFAGPDHAGVDGPGLGFLADELADLMRTVKHVFRAVYHGTDPETLRQVRLALERCKNDIREILARAGAAGQSTGTTSGAPSDRF